jgi:membrane protein
MVLGVGFLLLVSLVVSAGLAAMGKFMAGILPQTVFVGHIVDLIFSIGILTLLFAILFKYLPDTMVAWRDVWVGAWTTSILFTVGKSLIGLYLGRSSVASAYGAAGSLVVLLLWIYYAAQIFLFGAEVAKVYARQYGSAAVPTREISPESSGDALDLLLPTAPAELSWSIEPSIPPTPLNPRPSRAAPVGKAAMVAMAAGWLSVGGITAFIAWLFKRSARSH